MRRYATLALVCLFALAPTAGAIEYQVSGGVGNGLRGLSGGVGGSGGAGGGGGQVLINDLERYESSRTLMWERSWHNGFFDAHKDDCIKAKRACYSSPAGRNVIGDSGNFSTPAFGSGLSTSVWNRVRIENKCPLRGRGDYRDASAAGGRCTTAFNNIGSNGFKGWQEIHVDAPFASTQPIQGNPVAAIVRVWRECRGTLRPNTTTNQLTGYVTEGSNGANPDVKGGGDSCETTPIFERVVPANDSKLNGQNEWFFGTWDNGSYRAGGASKTAANALRKSSAQSAGAFYRSCDARSFNAADRKYGCAQGKDKLRGAGEYEGGSDDSGNFQRSCKNGGLGTNNVKWNEAELYGQAIYEADSSDVASRRSWYRRNMNALRAWIKEPSSKWPVGVTTDTNKRYFCNELNEWISVNWDLPGSSASQQTDVKITFNGIPGRLYATQVVLLDRAENILSQNVQLATGGATPVCLEDSPDCGPPPVCRPPAGQSRCGGPSQPAASAPPVKGTINSSCDQAALTNDPALCRSTSDSAVAQNDDGEFAFDGGDNADDYAAASAWFPRSFGGKIYNHDDVVAGEAALDANHPDRTFLFGGTPWGFRNIDDPLPSGFPTSGFRGQGALVTDPNGSLRAGFTSSVSRATEVPARNAFDPVGNINERLRTDDVRYTELIGENRRPQGQWSPQAGTNRPGWRRLTSESCADGSPQWNDFAGNQRGCQSGEGGLNVGDLGRGWQAHQAYYLPPTGGAGGTDLQRDLAVNFTQEGNGRCKSDYDDDDSTNCAKLLLDGHGTDLRARTTAIEVYNARDYVGGGEPLYHAANAPGADGLIRFCPPTKRINVKIADERTETVIDWDNLYVDETVPHSQFPQFRLYENSSNTGPGNDAIYGSDANDIADISVRFATFRDRYNARRAFYTEDRWISDIDGIQSDVAYYKRNSDGNLYDYNDMQRQINNGAANAGNFTVVWGRTWWKRFERVSGAWQLTHADVDAGAYRMLIPGVKTVRYEAVYEQRIVPNESCVGGSGTTDPAAVDSINMSSQAYDAGDDGIPYSADDQPANALPAGQYVVVYKTVLNGFSGGHWGVISDTSWRDGMSWVNAFSYDSSRFLLPVYESRPVG